MAYRDVVRGVLASEGSRDFVMLLGIEAQTHVDCAMPLRVMGYDYLSFRNALESLASRKEGARGASGKRDWQRFAAEDRIPSVGTLVVFFSPEPWTGSVNLRGMSLRVPEPFQKLATDYEIKVMAPYSLTDEEINCFKTDLRELMLAIKYAKDVKKLKELASSERFRRMRSQAVEVFNAVTHSRFKIHINPKEGWVDMGYALDDIHADGMAIGKKHGMAIGEKLGEKRCEANFANRFIAHCKSDGMSKENIAEQLRSIFGLPAKEADYYIHLAFGD